MDMHAVHRREIEGSLATLGGIVSFHVLLSIRKKTTFLYSFAQARNMAVKEHSLETAFYDQAAGSRSPAGARCSRRFLSHWLVAAARSASAGEKV